MRFFLVIALLFPLMAAEFLDEIFLNEEDNDNSRAATCSTPSSPPADTTDTRNHKSIVRGATNTVNTSALSKTLEILSKPKSEKTETETETRAEQT